MPTNKKDTKWMCTVNQPWDVITDNMEKFLEEHPYERVIGYLHHGDVREKPHAHFVIEFKNEISGQTLKNHLRDYFKIEREQLNNKSVCAKIWDGEIPGAVSYLLHDKDGKPFVTVGFSAEQLADAAEHNAKIQKRIEKKAESAKTHWELMEEILDQCVKTQLVLVRDKDDHLMPEREFDKYEMWDVMIRTLNQHKVRLNEHEIERFFLTMYRQKSMLHTVRDKIFSKLGI